MLEVEIAPGRHLIRQSCYPAGIRLPKLRDPWSSTHSTGYHGLHRSSDWAAGKEWDFETRQWLYPAERARLVAARANPTRRDGGRHSKPPAVTIQDGNLPRALYAHWRGVVFKQAVYSECRFCGQSCLSERDREEHSKLLEGSPVGYSHAKLCQFAAKLLLGRKQCVVCSISTSGSKWGVPLCLRQACYDAWQFAPAKSLRNWVEAVKFVDGDLQANPNERLFIR